MDHDDVTAPWHLLAEGSFGKFVEALRHLSPDKGYRKSHLAEIAGVSEGLVYRWEHDYVSRALELGLLYESDGQYYLNEESALLERLTLLNAAVDRRLVDLDLEDDRFDQ